MLSMCYAIAGLIYILYPVVYKPLCQLFRWYALLENIVRYSPFGAQAFPVRERHELGLLPPVPEFAMNCPQDIDWRTIWAAKEDKSSNGVQGQHKLQYMPSLGNGVMV